MHYRINELGDIQTEPEHHGGLTPAGERVIAEMNRLGMVVDGAHASSDTPCGILAASRTPIIVSHTDPAALRPFAHHLSGDLIRAVAAKGGCDRRLAARAPGGRPAPAARRQPHPRVRGVRRRTGMTPALRRAGAHLAATSPTTRTRTRRALPGR